MATFGVLMGRQQIAKKRAREKGGRKSRSNSSKPELGQEKEGEKYVCIMVRREDDTGSREMRWYMANISGGEDCLKLEKNGKKRVPGTGEKIVRRDRVPPILSPFTTLDYSFDVGASVAVGSTLYFLGSFYKGIESWCAFECDISEGIGKAVCVPGPPFNARRRHGQITSLDNKLYVFGGTPLNLAVPWAEVLDPINDDTWRILPQPPCWIPWHTLCVTPLHLLGKIYVGAQFYNVRFMFDVTNGIWEEFGRLHPNCPSEFWGALGVGKTLYCFHHGRFNAYDVEEHRFSWGYLTGPESDRLNRREFPCEPVLFHLNDNLFGLLWWDYEEVPGYYLHQQVLHFMKFLVSKIPTNDHQDGLTNSLDCRVVSCRCHMVDHMLWFLNGLLLDGTDGLRGLEGNASKDLVIKNPEGGNRSTEAVGIPR